MSQSSPTSIQELERLRALHRVLREAFGDELPDAGADHILAKAIIRQ